MINDYYLILKKGRIRAESLCLVNKLFQLNAETITFDYFTYLNMIVLKKPVFVLVVTD